MLGGLLSLISAATFGLNTAMTRRGVLSGSVMQAMAITVPFGVPMFLLICLLTGSLGATLSFSLNAYLLLAAAGIVHFVIGRYFNYAATAAAGANVTGPAQQLDIIVSLGLAVAVLGEYLTPLRVLGILLVVSPAFVLARKRSTVGKAHDAGAAAKPSASLAKPKWEPKVAEGMILAALAAVCYGSSPILVRAALENVTIQSSIAAGLISYIAATLAIAVWILARGQVGHCLDVKREAGQWFVFAAILVGASQLFRYMALALAPVAVVQPIQRLSGIFRVVFSTLLNREHEVLDNTVISATAVSIIGALLLSLSVDSVIAALPLPSWLAAVLRWHWP